MATNDTLRQRKREEKTGSGWDDSQVNWGESQRGNVNLWNNWGSLSGAGVNNDSGRAGQSFAFGGWPASSSDPFQTQTGAQFQNADQLSQPQYKTANEYAQAVQQWLWQYHYWNQMNMYYSTFPFYATSCWPMPMAQQVPQAQQLPTPGLANVQATPNGGQVPQVQNNFSRPGAQGQGQVAGRFLRPVNGQRQGLKWN